MQKIRKHPTSLQCITNLSHKHKDKYRVYQLKLSKNKKDISLFSKFRISRHKPELSAQGLTVMPFMQDLRSYDARYCNEKLLKNFEIWAKFEIPQVQTKQASLRLKNFLEVAQHEKIKQSECRQSYKQLKQQPQLIEIKLDKQPLDEGRALSLSKKNILFEGLCQQQQHTYPAFLQVFLYPVGSHLQFDVLLFFLLHLMYLLSSYLLCTQTENNISTKIITQKLVSISQHPTTIT